MRGAYYIPSKICTNILLKVWKTSSEIFNWNIISYYAYTDEMETKYYIKDTRLRENYDSNDKYGLVGVCG